MLIKLDSARLEKLKTRLETDEDCEMTGEREYVLDVFDFDPPLTMELELHSNGVNVLACERLEYSDEMDGWYVAGRVTDEVIIKDALIGKPSP